MSQQADGRAWEFGGSVRGIVINVDDPDGDHRVKASMPLQPETVWMRPITFGGGGPKRGGHIAPKVGDEVAVWTVNGDPNDLIYATIGWRRVKGSREAPTDMVAAGTGAKEVQPIFELGPIRLTVDERAGSRAVRLGAYVEGTALAELELDVEKGILALSALAGILVETRGTLTLRALVTDINKRRVRTSPEPI